jgi:Fatty acid desaturase
MWAAFSPEFRASLTNILAAFEGAGAVAMAIVVPPSTWCSPIVGHSRSQKSSHTSSSKSSPISADVLLNSSSATAISSPASPTRNSCSPSIDPNLTLADRLVLRNLLHDARSLKTSPARSADGAVDRPSDVQTLDELAALSNPTNTRFQPVVFTTWDCSEFPPWISTYVLQPYIVWASSVVRYRSDVVFLTYILVLFTVGIPNLVLLFLRFNWFQAVFQWALITYFVGPYSILLHNHIHGRGVMSKPWALVDTLFPYILGPMMGQTWNSFYYHHKHHHVEENGPEDLSSTLRYQRDSAFNLALYISRFVFLIWFELPLYYIRKGKLGFAFKFFTWEILSYAFMVLLARVNFAAAMTGVVLPFIQWRVAIMANNWGQHAFIDEDEPDSNLRCSITLIDVVVSVPSGKQYCLPFFYIC